MIETEENNEENNAAEFEEKSEQKTEHSKSNKSKHKAVKHKKKKKCRKYIIIALILFIAGLGMSYASRNQGMTEVQYVLLMVADVSPPVAVVNEEEITLDQMNQDYDMFFFVNGYPEQYKQLITFESFLNQSIVESLLLQEAKKQGINLSDEEAERIFYETVNRSLIDLADLEQQLKSEGLTLDGLKSFNKKQTTMNNLLTKTIPQATVSDEDAKKYYEDNKDLFETSEQLDLAHILIKTDTRTDKEAKALIDQLADKINSSNFAELAKKHSEDLGSKDNGGEYTITRGQTVKEFEDVAFSLKQGQISEPFKSTYGYHIIILYKKIPAQTKTFVEVKDQIKQALQYKKQQESVQTYVLGIWNSADVKVNFDLLKKQSDKMQPEITIS